MTINELARMYTGNVSVIEGKRVVFENMHMHDVCKYGIANASIKRLKVHSNVLEVHV